MGADAPGKQELESAWVARARVFVDAWDQAAHSGEINVPRKAGVIQDVAGSLPALLCGEVEGRTDPDRITIFDSTGLAIQDMALARLALDAAQRRGIGRSVEFSIGAGTS